MTGQVNGKKIQDRRTIRTETKKIFVVIFAVLAMVGLFAVGATWKGKQVFQTIESSQLPIFQSASKLQQKTLEIVGIYYLLSGKNDLDLQMAEMWRYDELAKAFNENLDEIKKSAGALENAATAQSIAKLSDSIHDKFEDLNTTAREMMLSNMNGDPEKGKVHCKQLVEKLKTFKEEVSSLEGLVNADLKRGTSQALIVLSSSSIAGILLTIVSIFISMALIRYLMTFLSVSLLPISNLMHNLRQSVFSIDKTGKVVSPASKYSEKIFDSDIVGEDIDHLLLDHLGKKSEA